MRSTTLHRPRRPLRALIAGGAMLVVSLPAAAPAEAQQLTWSGSLGYLEGTYGLAESSRSLVLVNTLSLHVDDWSLHLDVPVIDLNGPATRFAGGRPLPPIKGTGGNGGSGDGHGERKGRGSRTGGGTSCAGGGGGGCGGGGRGGEDGGCGDDGCDHKDGPLDATGIGDPLLRAQVELPAGDGRLDVYASVKVPVNGADRAYATGKWDAGAGLVYRRWFGRWLGRAETSWWRLGDPPEGELSDPWAVRLEAGHALGEWWGSCAGEAVGETVPGYGNAASVEVALRHRLGGDASLGGMVAVGLTDATPDLVVALEWSWSF